MSALNNKAYDILVKDYLSKGVNYPTALSKALSDLNGTIINTPNDLLGLCYIKEIIKQKANIEPISIKLLLFLTLGLSKSLFFILLLY